MRRIFAWLRRRRPTEEPIVPTYPTIEIEQPYGGWNADPYDTGTGHGERPAPLVEHPQRPSERGWRI